MSGGSELELPPITEREAVGRLWLPWYVRRSDEAQVATLPDHAWDARRLHLGEFCDEPDRFAGVRDMKWARIEHYCAEFAAGADPRPSAFVFFVDGSWLLTDRNHRCCAIYLGQPPGWVVRLVPVAPLVGGHDLLPGLT